MNTRVRWIYGRLFTAIVAVWLLTGRVSLWAQTTTAAAPLVATPVPPQMATSSRLDPDMNLGRSMGALFLILCGLLAAAYFMKRRGIPGFGAVNLRRIQMIEKYPIDAKRALLLVALDDYELLLGVGPDRITPLHKQHRHQPNGEKSVAIKKETIAS